MLPVDPSNFPANPDGFPDVNAAIPKRGIIATQIQRFTGHAPDVDYVPLIYPPERYSLREFTSIILSATRKLKQMLFFGIVADREILSRFYLSNVATARAAFRPTRQLTDRLFTVQATDPSFMDFVNDGINQYVATMNQAIKTYLGTNNVDANQENQTVNQLNEAIENFNALTSPSSADLTNLNALITNYNAYASMRNNAINSYNNAVTLYNSQVGVAVPDANGMMKYPSGSLNNELTNFNAKYRGFGIFDPLPYFQNLGFRETLPLLPMATFSAAPPLVADRAFRPVLLAKNNSSYQSIPAFLDPFKNEDGTISINQFPFIESIPSLPVTTPPDPFASINSNFNSLNSLISQYNLQVGTLPTPLPGTENEAINQLNQAIDTWNHSEKSETDLVSLKNAINSYNQLVYGSSPFSPTNPSPGSFNDKIREMNVEINSFNTSVLGNSNEEVALKNIGRKLFGLPLIPAYESKSPRDLMPVAPEIPAGALASELASFSQLPNVDPYSSIPEMSQFAIEANFLYNKAVGIHNSVQSILLDSLTQSEDVNFLSYQSMLKGAGSIPSLYNQSISDYLTASAPNPGGMPAAAVSGSSILLDPATQNLVRSDLLSVLNQTPPLPNPMIQQKIDEYNHYASFVNQHAIATFNDAINHLMTTQVGVLDPVTGKYPPGTLNNYGDGFNETYSGKHVIGPLKILDLQNVPEMVANLPPVSTLVTVNGQSHSIYSIPSYLNAMINNADPGAGHLSVSEINQIISDYNVQVGDASGSNPDTENGVINSWNTALLSTFLSNASSSPASADPNVYFSALDQLRLAKAEYESNRSILNEGGTLGSSPLLGINPLNTSIASFNNHSLNSINAAVSSLLPAVNDSLLPYGFLPFTELSKLPLQERLSGNLSDVFIPGEGAALEQNRTTFKQVGFQYNLPVSDIPTILPDYFSLKGANNDLEDFNNTVYLPLVNTIETYNTTSNPQQGINYENETISLLNTAISGFKAGNLSSMDLKQAVSTYIQSIATNSNAVNNQINLLNDQIKNYQTIFEKANNSLEFWGLPKISNDFMINQRKALTPPPLPLFNDTSYVTSNYASSVNTLSLRNPQNYPSTTRLIKDPITGNTTRVTEPVEFADNAVIVAAANATFQRRNILKDRGFKIYSKFLKQILDNNELMEFFRGKRIEYPDAYIEFGLTPISPVWFSPVASLAALSVGLSSHHFESLINNELFKRLLERSNIQDVGVLGSFQILSFEVLHKITRKAFFTTMLAFGNQIPNVSLNAFRNPDITSFAPIIAGAFVQEVRKYLSDKNITNQLVKDVLSPDAPRALVEGVSAAFNLSLISNSLTLVGNILGKNVPRTILDLVGNEMDVEDPHTFVSDNLLDRRLRDDRETAVNLRNALNEAKNAQIENQTEKVPTKDSITNNVYQEALLKAGLNDQLLKNQIKTSATRERDFDDTRVENPNIQLPNEEVIPPQKAQDLSDQELANQVIKEANEKKQIDASILEEQAKKTNKSLPDETFREPQLVEDTSQTDSSITPSQRENIIDESTLPSRPVINLSDSSEPRENVNINNIDTDLIVNNIINERNNAQRIANSLLQNDALRFQRRKDLIRSELIGQNHFDNVEIVRDLSLRGLRDSIQREIPEIPDVNPLDIANRTINLLNQRQTILKEIDQNELLKQLIKNKVITDDEQTQPQNQQLLTRIQREFDQKQDLNKAPIDTLKEVLNMALDTDTSNVAMILQNPNIILPEPPQSKLDDILVKLDEKELRQLINDRIEERLHTTDQEQRTFVKNMINESLLDSHLSLKNLLQENVKRLNSLQDAKVDSVIVEDFKSKFATMTEPSVFLLKLQDPLYFGIYCIGAGLMYDKNEKNDYRRDIEIHI